jgi:hypothetical protein
MLSRRYSCLNNQTQIYRSHLQCLNSSRSKQAPFVLSSFFSLSVCPGFSVSSRLIVLVEVVCRGGRLVEEGKLVSFVAGKLVGRGGRKASWVGRSGSCRRGRCRQGWFWIFAIKAGSGSVHGWWSHHRRLRFYVVGASLAGQVWARSMLCRQVRFGFAPCPAGRSGLGEFHTLQAGLFWAHSMPSRQVGSGFAPCPAGRSGLCSLHALQVCPVGQ